MPNVKTPKSPLEGLNPNPSPKVRKKSLFTHITPTRTLEELLNTKDITTLTYDEQKTLQKFINKREKEIESMREKEPEFESSKNYTREKTKPLWSTTPAEMFSRLMRQEQFMSEYSTDVDLKTNKKKYKDVEELTENDKWTILRRIATEDIMLNVDRAYASRTLKEIEDDIYSGEYSSIDEIADKYLERYRAKEEDDKTWDVDLHPFSDDVLLNANQGFHGIDKARDKFRRNIDNYAPVWDNPEKFAGDIIDIMV